MGKSDSENESRGAHRGRLDATDSSKARHGKRGGLRPTGHLYVNEQRKTDEKAEKHGAGQLTPRQAPGEVLAALKTGNGVVTDGVPTASGARSSASSISSAATLMALLQLPTLPKIIGFSDDFNLVENPSTIPLCKPLFKASTSAIIFKVSSSNNVYQATLRLRNEDRVARTVRIVGPDSDGFSVEINVPNAQSQSGKWRKVAPGMSVAYTVGHCLCCF
eukprot:GHVT01082573.1.p1 GENE.GHVT01082573.1~~GHVT01082573.1.p1  ORF type:complete len:219 (-),score=19.49 GHVT01082573.1:220-876(-)